MTSLGAPLLPSIADATHVSLATAQWILTAALLAGGLATPIMGHLADGPRQRTVVLTTLVILIAGSVLAVFAPTFAILVLARGLQGVGFGVVPVTMAIARRHQSPGCGGPDGGHPVGDHGGGCRPRLSAVRPAG
jgi:MFS family permease